MKILPLFLFLSVAASAQTYSFSTLANFPPARTKGPQFAQEITIDPAGNIYGTSQQGGTHGDGTVFKVTLSGVLSTVYNFAGGSDGADPVLGIVRDSAGNLYGVTTAGGTGYDTCDGGCGTVFKVTPAGKETVLYRFTNGADGGEPIYSVTVDSQGNLYGYTYNFFVAPENGSLYKITPNGMFSILHVFCSQSSCTDGSSPASRPIIGSDGNLYGVTAIGGAFNWGTVFKMTPDGQETVLYNFTGGNDGGEPLNSLAQDAHGNMYGSALKGALNSGVLFKITQPGAYSLLYTFNCAGANCSDDPQTISPVVLDSTGDIFGLYILNVNTQVQEVYEVMPSGTETVIHTAGKAGVGFNLVMDKSGNLYGTSFDGGPSHLGSVWKLAKQ